MRLTGAVASSIRWHFFLLGAGFLLLGPQIISNMELLFETTWVVNSVVIAGFLFLIVVSNFVVQGGCWNRSRYGRESARCW